VKVKTFRLQPPPPSLALAQIVSAALGWFAAAAILFVLLPSTPGASFGSYLAAFALALLAGALSQLPGGIGVFDSTLLFLLSPMYLVPAITGALILYRLIYFLLPLLVGVLVLLRREMIYAESRLPSLTRRFSKRVAGVLPSAMTLAVFLSGVLLLFSGATPALSIRMDLLQSIIPLPVVEASHLLSSVIGVLLLFLARGLQRRLDIAYATSVILIISAIAVSLTKGAAWEQATILLAVLAALIALRKHFYRRSRLMDTPFSPRWIVAVILVLMATAWLTVFAHRPVALNRYLWLQVTPEGDAARSLRALGGVLGVAALLFIYRGVLSWLQGRRRKPDPESPIIRRIVNESSCAYAALALLGDKRFLLNEEQDAFIMYTVSGKSWIAMGDPLGPQNRWPELIWQFKEESDRQGYRPLFYETGRESVPIYGELGLTAFLMGQEARVELESFSVRGRENHDLRNARNRMTREGWELAILHQGELEPFLSKLEAVSDAWLSSKKSRERGFAVGWFDPDYLSRFPVAVVRRGEEVIAFANLLETRDREEASVDLMRHRPGAPSQTMDFLFVGLMERAGEKGFRWFNLGLAPLSGMEQQELSPLWHRLAGILYRHGDHFYSFQGLRSYKEKFHPRWEPKYLVTPSGLSLPGALIDLTRLAARGRPSAKRKIVDR
jgi:phosphatidylglycerol lysyltransferase